MSDIACAVAVHEELVNVPGQQAHVQTMWKQAVGTGQWSRLVADMAGCQVESSHRAGLLPEIGKPAALQAVAELARRAAAPLSEDEIGAVAAEFRAAVGSQLAVA